MSIRDARCGACWAEPGHPCISQRTGKPMKTMHTARKLRAVRRGVYGLRSVIRRKD